MFLCTPVTGNFSLDDMPTLLRKASQGYCTLFDKQIQANLLLNGRIVQKVRPGEKYIIQDHNSVDHVYRSKHEPKDILA